jgi:hypothetical protein
MSKANLSGSKDLKDHYFLIFAGKDAMLASLSFPGRVKKLKEGNIIKLCFPDFI